MIEQVDNGRGHRERLYHHKNCRMAASRARQRAAAEEAERQRLLALERAEKGEIYNRFPLLAAESIDLLYQLKKHYGLHLVSVVGVALQRERSTPAPPQPKDLLQANIISWGHQLGFPAICEQGIDVPAELAGWWHYANYTPDEVLELFFSIVKRLYLEQQHVAKVSA